MGQEDKTNEWSNILNISIFPPSFIYFSTFASFNCQLPSSALSLHFQSFYFSLSLSFLISLWQRTSEPLSFDSLSITHWCTVSTVLLISKISIKLFQFTLDLSLETFTFIYLYISCPVYHPDFAPQSHCLHPLH